MFFTGDFNAHSQNWWPDGNANNEGIAIYNLLSALDLHQIIWEPTNFEENKKPYCIGLMFCDQPNIMVDRAVRCMQCDFHLREFVSELLSELYFFCFHLYKI